MYHSPSLGVGREFPRNDSAPQPQVLDVEQANDLVKIPPARKSILGTSRIKGEFFNTLNVLRAHPFAFLDIL